MMKKAFDWREPFQKLAALPIFKSHFAWGPLNAFVLLAGIGVTARRPNAACPRGATACSGAPRPSCACGS